METSVLVLSATLGVLCVQLAVGFPSGAPPDVCGTNLAPIHGSHQATGSSSEAPFTLTASASTYSPNKPITVVLKGLSGRMFKGFAIQAQNANSRRPITSGEWSGTSVKDLPCAAVTHTSPTGKGKLELTWTPKGSGEVTFVATVVEKFDIFYTDIQSTVRSSSSAISSNDFHDSGKKARPTSSLEDTFGSPSFDSRPSSTHKEDDAIGANSQNDQFSSFYQRYPGYSQQEADLGEDQTSESLNYFRNPYSRYPFSGQSFNRQGEDRQPEASEAFANYPSPSDYHHRFAHPQQHYPHQFRTPDWQYPHF